MTLNERVAADMKTAMKNNEKLRLETLRMLRAQLIDLTKRGFEKAVSPDDELAVLLTAIKKRKEAIDLYQQAGRKELVYQEETELGILQTYLPKQLGREEIRTVIQKIVRETGAPSPNDFGKVMGLAMKELKGKTDGRTVQELVKEALKE